MTTTPDVVAASESPAPTKPTRGALDLLFWGGALLAIVSIAIYVGQVSWAKRLFTPWYMPIGGTIAALAMLYVFSRQRRIWQLPLALFCGALAALEWYFLLVLSVLPNYTGPVAAGSPLPAFHAAMADGQPIDETYFKEGPPTALVFFQGRWCPFCMTHLAELEKNYEEIEKVGARVVVVSLEDDADANITSRDFPHLTVISDHDRELSNAADLINRNFAPDGSDADAPTVLLLDRQGIVRWVHRPTRFIERPTAAELARRLSEFQ